MYIDIVVYFLEKMYLKDLAHRVLNIAKIVLSITGNFTPSIYTVKGDSLYRITNDSMLIEYDAKCQIEWDSPNTISVYAYNAISWFFISYSCSSDKVLNTKSGVFGDFIKPTAVRPSSPLDQQLMLLRVSRQNSKRTE